MTRFKWGVLGCGILLLIASLVMRIAGRPVAVLGPGSQRPVIIIDPGHGGEDGGAVGVDGIVEKDINLAISFTLRDLFTVNGFQVVMTRTEDISIHDPGVEGTRRQKTSDLHNRMALMEQYPGAIFISIHQNKFGQASSRGTQVFYGPKNEASKALAETLQRNVAATLQEGNTRQCKQGEKNLYLIYEASCPAILVECGFLSNPQEARQLTDKTYQDQIAFTVLHSVMEYLGLKASSL